MPDPSTATPLLDSHLRNGAPSLQPADVILCAGAFCLGFVLERLFRPFRKPVVVFFRHPVPYPHREKTTAVPNPRQLA